MQNRRMIHRALMGAIAGLGLLVSTPHAVAAGPGDSAEKGPLSGADSVRIEIEEKGAGELGFSLPLPDRRQGHAYPWSEAEVNTVRSGGKGFCRVEVRRGADDPAHELELKLRCGQHKDNGRSTDLRLETTHTFTKRKKAVVAEFSHPDGSQTVVTVAAK